MTAAALVLARSVPTLKPEGSLVRFAFNPDASLLENFNQLMAAVADGQLTVEEGQKIADMLRARAEIAVLEGGDSSAQKIVDAFKQFASGIEARTVAPYTTPGSTDPSGGSTPPLAPPPSMR